MNYGCECSFKMYAFNNSHTNAPIHIERGERETYFHAQYTHRIHELSIENTIEKLIEKLKRRNRKNGNKREERESAMCILDDADTQTRRKLMEKKTKTTTSKDRANHIRD